MNTALLWATAGVIAIAALYFLFVRKKEQPTQQQQQPQP
jgi:hypothetical protein